MFWGDGDSDLEFKDEDRDDAAFQWGKVARWKVRTRTAWRGLMMDGGFVTREYQSAKLSVPLARKLFRGSIRLLAHWLYRRSGFILHLAIEMLRYLDETAGK